VLYSIDSDPTKAKADHHRGDRCAADLEEGVFLRAGEAVLPEDLVVEAGGDCNEEDQDARSGNGPSGAMPRGQGEEVALGAFGLQGADHAAAASALACTRRAMPSQSR
jgi:hypothetical protein